MKRLLRLIGFVALAAVPALGPVPLMYYPFSSFDPLVQLLVTGSALLLACLVAVVEIARWVGLRLNLMMWGLYGFAVSAGLQGLLFSVHPLTSVQDRLAQAYDATMIAIVSGIVAVIYVIFRELFVRFFDLTLAYLELE
jgi:membrane protease YdiL (CAAX protease family)